MDRWCNTDGEYAWRIGLEQPVRRGFFEREWLQPSDEPRLWALREAFPDAHYAGGLTKEEENRWHRPLAEVHEGKTGSFMGIARGDHLHVDDHRGKWLDSLEAAQGWCEGVLVAEGWEREPA